MNWVCYPFLAVIRLYQWVVSPAKTFLFGPSAGCRYHPSCSEYACEALRVHGLFRGGFLTVRRLTRCHPWGGCGYDPVPSDELGKASVLTESCPGSIGAPERAAH